MFCYPQGDKKARSKSFEKFQTFWNDIYYYYKIFSVIWIFGGTRCYVESSGTTAQSKVVTCLWLVLLLKCPQICSIRRHPQKICTTTPGYFLTYLSREVSISVPASYLHLLLYLELCPIKIGREFPARNVRKKILFIYVFLLRWCRQFSNM